MLEIGYIVICEDIIEQPTELIIKKPLPILTPLSLPGNYSFKVAFSLHNLDEETFGEENTISIKIIDPEKRVVFDTGVLKLKTEPNKKTKNQTIEIAEANVGLNNIDFYLQGIHKLILTVNDVEKEYNIPVKERDKEDE